MLGGPDAERCCYGNNNVTCMNRHYHTHPLTHPKSRDKPSFSSWGSVYSLLCLSDLQGGRLHDMLWLQTLDITCRDSSKLFDKYKNMTAIGCALKFVKELGGVSAGDVRGLLQL